MKSIKTLFVVIALTASSLAMAEGGADRTFARMEQARKVSMEAYQLAQQQKKESPVASNKTQTADHADC
ncbi:co-regulatory protein PtrA N-terminal domain-containing protein [Pseudomonas sp.]|uniref:co-regulatory protein PtrA N-terminal domain-containing protein n=1 Tax=Pseudomonas sp. TaxID=306 RepID=UPI0027313D38|nr:co-regulatory protein PtrA N-terminal domain-containing protein [Pseudomonas sp.]MDP2243144.1 co-regulatory protein PtrA N-terminal domain-containing protein [Pseudomonas sp.]